MAMTRGAHTVATGLVVVVLARLLVLVLGPARGARADIGTQHTLAVATQTRDLAAQTLSVARGAKADADQQLTISRVLQALGRELEAIARETLRHAASIDRKTGPTP